ncbi:MAG: PH domain-containing protein [Nocardioides sp.]|nr:PH domain-containing protein [Nocardioides sp.]
MSQEPPSADPGVGWEQQPGPGWAPPAPELSHDEEWQRLDPRMLLVHPVREVLRFLPVLIGVFVAGRSTGGGLWQVTAVVVPVGLGLLRYLTTTFRIHAGRVELRRGLVNRHVLSTPVERVRTVDLTSSLIHRVLGLTTVRIGTGTASSGGDDQLDLDGLPTARAQALRAELLRIAPTGEATGVEHPAAPLAPVDGPPIVSFDLGWLRFAPFTSGGLVIAGAVLGVLTQVGDDLGLFRRLDPESLVRGDRGPTVALIVATVIVVLALISLFAVLGYLVTNWGFALTRPAGGGGAAWQVRRGLLTTRETTLDVDRVAGVVVGEQAGLRLARGRRLAATVTGLDSSQQTSSSLTPPAPTAVVLGAAAQVLGTAAPVRGPLTPHGPAAVRRRWTRALVPAVVLAGGAVVAVVLGAPVWVLAGLAALPAAVLLAVDRCRSLGHALVGGCVVARSGSLTRKRAVLGVDHVIGWNLRATWFQRRVGLTTLVATTAGGSQSVTLLDLPQARAVELAGRAIPELVDQFLVRD